MKLFCFNENGGIKLEMKVYDLMINKNGAPELFEVKTIHEDLNIKWTYESSDCFIEYLDDNLNLSSLISENVYVVQLDNGMNLLNIIQLNIGNGKESIIDYNKLFTSILVSGVKNFILMHNHPNWDSKCIFPSESDKSATDVIDYISEILNIQLIEHFVVSERGYSMIKMGAYVDYSNLNEDGTFNVEFLNK